MKVNILASGSGGNCIALQSGTTTILVDAGVAKTKIEKRLLEIGIRPNEIKAILVTHAHSDHVKGLPLSNKYKIPVFASDGEWKSIKNVDSENQRTIRAYEDFVLEKEFHISSFKTHHDAHDPLGFTVSDYQGNKCSICLDTGRVDDQMLEAMEFSNIYIIEANHEPNMVEVSDYPNSVKARIVSHIGHLSNEQTAEALGRLINGTKERIYLTHLSSRNNMPTLAEMTVKRALLRKGLKVDKDYKIEVV